VDHPGAAHVRYPAAAPPAAMISQSDQALPENQGPAPRPADNTNRCRASLMLVEAIANALGHTSLGIGCVHAGNLIRQNGPERSQAIRRRPPGLVPQARSDERFPTMEVGQPDADIEDSAGLRICTSGDGHLPEGARNDGSRRPWLNLSVRWARRKSRCRPTRQLSPEASAQRRDRNSHNTGLSTTVAALRSAPWSALGHKISLA